MVLLWGTQALFWVEEAIAQVGVSPRVNQHRAHKRQLFGAETFREERLSATTCPMSP